MYKNVSAMHSHEHAFTGFNPRQREGLLQLDRRGMLKVSMAGLAGLSLPGLLAERAHAAETGRAMSGRKSVILLWMTGGPSHIDTWDPKPERPFNNRGPFGVIQTAQPGVFICDRLPKQAAMLDRFTVMRSVDARKSSHEPNMTFQTGNRESAPRRNRDGRMYPAIGSFISKHRGSNDPGMPPYVAFRRSSSHLAFAGWLGKQYDPFIANQASTLPVYDLLGNDTGKRSGADLFQFPAGVDVGRVRNRQDLVKRFDRLRRDIDQRGSLDAVDTYRAKAVDLLLGRRARDAFDLSKEDPATVKRYGKHLWCQQALLARRLVEAGSSFVTLDLSYHTASGTWDNHGIPGGVYGGISKGLGPLLPLFDHLLTTLVLDLEEHDLLEDTLVIAMGEFGRTPNMGTQGSTDGRNHWPVVMSMCMTGGGLNHNQTLGSTVRDGSHIKDRAIIPGDIAATIYKHMQVPLDSQYVDPRGRPRFMLEDGGEPISELF
jgi:hypothetical protein